jgi:2-isopropylmalate synthase
MNVFPTEQDGADGNGAAAATGATNGNTAEGADRTRGAHPGAGASRDADRVRIFDTTLRDGEQSPGISLNRAEKLEIAHQLARLGVDVIEAGFPITSPGDFESVQAIAREVTEPVPPVIAGLARTHVADIDAAWEAVRDAERPRIHTFISTSDIHIVHQLQTTRDDVKGQARAAVAHAKGYTDDVEFSPMDATRADVEFTAEVIAIAIEEGATTINVPDTVGYTMPHEFSAYLGRLYGLVPALRDVVLSVHCHDDLGLAVANSFAGVLAGARQVECAINGIGERAGNAALEEIVMLLRTRYADVGLDTAVNTTELARTSRLVSRLTGYPVQPNKAIIGRNAFAHESGIHQDGVLKERTTYEIMDATTVGLTSNAIVLGKHSGRHALRQALEELGFKIDGQALNTAFKRFKEIADKKKSLTAMDLEALVTDELRTGELGAFALVSFAVTASSTEPPQATVVVSVPADSDSASDRGGHGPAVDEGPSTVTREGSSSGDGSIDAVFRAINVATDVDASLREFRVNAVTEGQDALAEVSVVVEFDGQTGAGQGVSTDTVEAAARAYLRALSVAQARARVGDSAVGLPVSAGD